MTAAATQPGDFAGAAVRDLSLARRHDGERYLQGAEPATVLVTFCVPSEPPVLTVVTE